MSVVAVQITSNRTYLVCGGAMRPLRLNELQLGRYWMIEYRQSVQSHRHGRALVGLAPSNKAPSPPNWNMKHCKSVEFLSNLYVKLTCTDVKPSYWRLSGDGSESVCRYKEVNSIFIFETSQVYLLICSAFYSSSRKSTRNKDRHSRDVWSRREQRII